MLVYHDDIVIVGSSQLLFDSLIHNLSSIKDLGRLIYFLGIEIVRNSGGISYASYMENCKNVAPLCLLQTNYLRNFGKHAVIMMLSNIETWLEVSSILP